MIATAIDLLLVLYDVERVAALARMLSCARATDFAMRASRVSARFAVVTQVKSSFLAPGGKAL